jgi:hypothetical protein
MGMREFRYRHPPRRAATTAARIIRNRVFFFMRSGFLPSFYKITKKSRIFTLPNKERKR